MGFFQIGFEVNRLAPNPDKPNEELVPPPLFRPANLLFGPKNAVDSNNNKDIMSENTGAAASVRAGPWSAQLGTCFTSDHVAMHQLISGVYVGGTALTIGRLLRSPVATAVATVPILVVISGMMASASAITTMAKPRDDRRASAGGGMGGDADPL